MSEQTITINPEATKLVRDYLTHKFGYYQGHFTKFVNDLIIKELKNKVKRNLDG